MTVTLLVRLSVPSGGAQIYFEYCAQIENINKPDDAANSTIGQNKLKDLNT